MQGTHDIDQTTPTDAGDGLDATVPAHRRDDVTLQPLHLGERHLRVRHGVAVPRTVAADHVDRVLVDIGGDASGFELVVGT